MPDAQRHMVLLTVPEGIIKKTYMIFVGKKGGRLSSVKLRGKGGRGKEQKMGITY